MEVADAQDGETCRYFLLRSRRSVSFEYTRTIIHANTL
jgi:hypothetical protein